VSRTNTSTVRPNAGRLKPVRPTLSRCVVNSAEAVAHANLLTLFVRKVASFIISCVAILIDDRIKQLDNLLRQRNLNSIIETYQHARGWNGFTVSCKIKQRIMRTNLCRKIILIARYSDYRLTIGTAQTKKMRYTPHTLLRLFHMPKSEIFIDFRNTEFVYKAYSLRKLLNGL